MVYRYLECHFGNLFVVFGFGVFVFPIFELSCCYVLSRVQILEIDVQDLDAEIMQTLDEPQ